MINCPICSQKNTNTSHKAYYGYDLVHCADCDYEFMHPYKAPGAEYYEASDDELSAIRHVKLEAWPSNHPSYNTAIFNKPSLSVLDIGCSNGAFVAFAADKGNSVIGMDFDNNSLKLAASRNLKNTEFILGDLSDLKKLYPNKKFDVIAMFMVLEHIENPMQTINEIYELLNPGGYFIGTIPNEKRYLAKTYNLKSALPPLHLNYWNIQSFSKHINTYSKFSIATINNTAHYGYMAYVWKMKMMPKVKGNTLLTFAVRGVFTILSKIEIAIETITKNGSGTYFELKK